MAEMEDKSSANSVRVVTTLGHVDHGKTTFVDYLLAANNIISTRLAGKIRYLDSREDEQTRGITMESSAVSLRFRTGERRVNDTEDGPTSKTFTINLIDTPGHVDFSSEVSSASRLCDGALVLVDVVEGVCTQTVTVLRQAWFDRVRPILVLNKCDRLITELKLSSVEAYHHLSQLLEQVNAVMGSFFAGERLEDDLRWREEREKLLKERGNDAAESGDVKTIDDDMDIVFQEKDDEDLYFAPERGNVIFASAIDGWGFRVGKFAQLYASKLGIKEANLRRVLWGDYYLDPKTKRVIGSKHLKGRTLKPLFVQFVLDNIWAVYENILINPNPDKVAKIVATLGLKLLPRDLKTKDTRNLLTVVFGQWLSLSTCTIQAIIDVVPPPSRAQSTRMPKILYPELAVPSLEPKNKLEKDLFNCDERPGACVVGYVSKMFAVDSKDLPENRKKPLTAEEMRERGRISHTDEFPSECRPETLERVADASKETTILGFARLYSGILKRGSSIYCVLPKYDIVKGPLHPKNTDHIIRASVDGLYIMMGRELKPVDEVLAGNVFAIRGLEGKVLRIATLCAPGVSDLSEDDNNCLVNLGSVSRQMNSIVRVALEPANPANLPQLINGLKLLSQADPAVETFQQETGEHVILTAGELHLERCIKDLKEKFAKVDIHASEPIVPFRETAVKISQASCSKGVGGEKGTISGSSLHGVVQFTIRALPLPDSLHSFLRLNLSTIRRFTREQDAKDGNANPKERRENEVDENLCMKKDLYLKSATRSDHFWDSLRNVCKGLGAEWHNLDDKIWAFGPRSTGGCLLVDARAGVANTSIRKKLSRSKISVDSHANVTERMLQQFENSVETGFQLAVSKGPLCAEPVEGMVYFVEKLEFDPETADSEQSQDHLPQVIGSLITSVQDACRNGLLDWSPRLMLAMYSCDIQASTDVLGKVYGVVARRRGRIVSEEMREGTTFFTVKALLPVVESFGFATDIRKKTSGAASPQLIFSGFEMMDMDPFWVPTTEEELEDLGEKADRENVAKMYMDRVRQRKGLFVDRKIVESAEKQRTLKR